MQMIAPGGAKLRTYNCIGEIDTLARIWDSLRTQEHRFIPSFAETKTALQESGLEFCFITIENYCSITGITCFVNRRSTKNFSIGKRLSFSLPVRETRLYFSSVLGRVDELTLKAALHLAARAWPFDLMVLAEVEFNSPLLSAATTLGDGLVSTRPGSKRSVHWVINLPSSFDGYLKSLRSTTRKKALQTIRALERHGQYRLQVVQGASQIERFLSDGERVSRRTYQWAIGQRLQNDGHTRERYRRLAAEGRLRCYILYMGAIPCAFARGELSGTLYHYETPGFDPSFAKLSPGTVLLMWVIRDLIENTECKLFDFGSGGDYTSYKARFANCHFQCDRVDICNLYAPYSLFIFVIQQTLFTVKFLRSCVLGIGGLHQRMRRLILKRRNDTVA
jgi:hypothetical protein